jgi:hypothetical protein
MRGLRGTLYTFAEILTTTNSAFAVSSSAFVHLIITSKQVLNLAFPPNDHTQTIICLAFSMHSGLPVVLAFPLHTEQLYLQQ